MGEESLMFDLLTIMMMLSTWTETFSEKLPLFQLNFPRNLTMISDSAWGKHIMMNSYI